ncbi:hypothetical protein LTR20_008958 [Exophiala xenobiotica]|nr:hypothetical protein LTS13_011074 [Exophiala xenobiotica]KAK5392706.1 hypothetical protein LTR79_010172 [Exophiala xenobiotica]KAK5457607.1 hypothetical protein LTR20_008958 [Exophiala xenobiotica]KAK5511550.1 hypothetical protein LTR07_009402 [Exophiala xenobiotica]
MSTMAVAVTDKHVPSDSLSFQPQVISSSVRGLVTPSAISTTAKPLDLPELHAAIEKYAPILKIHPNEKYVPTSIEDFLSHCSLIDKKSSVRVKSPSLNQLPEHGEDHQFYLDLDPVGKPGTFSTAKAYVHAFWHPGLAHTDLQFWFFNAYNGPGSLHVNGLMMDSITSSGDIDLAPMGEHVGDWEMAMVRIDNTTRNLVAIWLSQHSRGQFFSLDQIPQAFMFEGTHPVIYSSRNGHANYSKAGSNPSEYRKIGGIPAGLDFFIRNDTGDGKLALDCSKKYELVSADWLPQTPPANWVNWPFRWGPEGTSTHLKPVAVAEIVQDALGPELAACCSISVLTVLAGEILPHFVKGDINGPTSPGKHGTWIGVYPVW